MSAVVCLDVSTAIFTISKFPSPDLFDNHMTLSFSQSVTYHGDHSLFGCASDKNSSLSPDKSVSAVKLTTVCILLCPLSDACGL